MSNSDFSKRLQEWQDKARQKAEEVNQRLDLRGRVDEGLRAASGVTRKVTNAVTGGLEAAKEQAEKLDAEHHVTDKVKQATTQAEETVKQAATQAQETIKEQTTNLRDTVKTAGTQAEDFFGSAKQSATREAWCAMGAVLTPTSVAGGSVQAPTWRA